MTANVRRAEIRDADDVYNLLRELHEELNENQIPYDEGTTKAFLHWFICSDDAMAAIYEDDGIQGVLIGVSAPSWWFDGRQVTDVVFYVRKDHRGKAGLPLLRAYREWGMSLPGVKQVYIGTSIGGAQAIRSENLYEAVGFKRIGAVYLAGEET
jgi:hypothetical protein